MSNLISDDAAIKRIANGIIQEGIVEGASDIRVKPGQSTLQVTLKVGDDWKESMPLPAYIREPLARRFKEMADMDLACSDKCQEGRIPVRYADRYCAVRLKTVPTPSGEQLLMRFESP